MAASVSILPVDPVFHFIVGEQRAEFYLPGSLFAKLSDPLNNLINGKFKEAKKKEAVWDSVSSETFALLVEFANSRNYSVKSLACEPASEDVDSDIEIVAVQPLKKRKRSNNTAHELCCSISKGGQRKKKGAQVDAAVQLTPGESPSATVMVRHVIHILDDITQPVDDTQLAESDDQETTPASPNRKNLKVAVRRRMAQQKIDSIKERRPDLQGIDLAYDNDGNRVLSTATMSTHFSSKFRANKFSERVVGASSDKYAAADNTEASLSQMLMVHARVYVLAAEKLIDGLKKLALRKIHWILLRYPHDRVRLPVLVDLARFVFENTFGDEDALRVMVVEHFALNVKKDDVGASDEFVQLMEDGGDFVKLFWRQTFWRRLH